VPSPDQARDEPIGVARRIDVAQTHHPIRVPRRARRKHHGLDRSGDAQRLPESRRVIHGDIRSQVDRAIVVGERLFVQRNVDQVGRRVLRIVPVGVRRLLGRRHGRDCAALSSRGITVAVKIPARETYVGRWPCRRGTPDIVAHAEVFDSRATVDAVANPLEESLVPLECQEVQVRPYVSMPKCTPLISRSRLMPWRQPPRIMRWFGRP